MNRKLPNQRTLLTAFAGVLAGLGVGLLLLMVLPNIQSDSSTGISGVQSLRVGGEAPDFRLKNLHGETLDLDDAQGKIVILNFWATWCGPCRVEMPHFQALHENRDDVAVMAVNFDESPEKVEAFVTELDLTFDILLDPGAKVQEQYQIRGYPTTYILDETGTIQVVHIGVLTEKQITDYLAGFAAQE